MTWSLLGVLALPVLPGGWAFGAPVVISQDEVVGVEWVGEGHVRIEVAGGEAEILGVEGTDEVVVRCRFAGGKGQPGEPELPVYVLLMENPPEGKPRVSWRFEEETVVEGRVAPVMTHRPRYVDEGVYEREVVRVRSESVYSGAGIFPAKPVQIEWAKMGERGFLRVAFYPVRYEPLGETILVAERMVVDVMFGSED